MKTAEHFIEAHYYAGGLRHQSFGAARGRPSWAPPADSVGFQDEFALENGDGAVELRRFELRDERITWLAVYYRSIDTKLGDRQNHAGVGVWIRNGVVTDTLGLLYGLSNLAAFLAKSVDVKALGGHIEKFSEPNFLPAYLQSEEGYGFARGAPAGAAAMVDTQQYFVSCPGGVGECRSLADYLLNLMVFGSEADLKPRSLVLVSAKEKPPSGHRITVIPRDFDAGAYVMANLPEIVGEIADRAKAAEAEVAHLRGELAALEGEAQSLRSEHDKQISLRDDPWNVVLRRIDQMSSQLGDLASQRSAPVPHVQSAPMLITKRSPVSGVRAPAEPEYEIDWFRTILVILLVVIFLFAIVLLVDRFVHF